MAYGNVAIHEIVDNSVRHSWSIPEFQRGFVWKATQVRDLAESLWYDYPIGTLLVWNSASPTEAALITMASLVDKFNDESNFGVALYWFLQASRFQRYSGSGTTSLDEDLKDIHEASSLIQAVQKLLGRLSHEAPEVPLEADDFLRDYGDSRFGRFLLYLLIYRNEAQDWDEHGHRIGFEGLEVLADFRPQWHHIFPQKYLEGKINNDLVNALANIAVIGPSINIRINSKDPLDYVTRYKIPPEKLEQQFVVRDFARTGCEGYEEWLRSRAKRLAQEGNAFLKELRGAL